jgi:hypothetical protein
MAGLHTTGDNDRWSDSIERGIGELSRQILTKEPWPAHDMINLAQPL